MHPTQTPEDSVTGGVPDNRPSESFSSEEATIAPILALHRHQDGYIAFAVARDAGGDFRPFVLIRADELARYFPSFRATRKSMPIDEHIVDLVRSDGDGLQRGGRSREEKADKSGYLHQDDRTCYSYGL